MSRGRRDERNRPTRSGDDTSRAPRQIPHNLQAEESLLGASMLSRSALEAMVRELTPEDFYKPAHVQIAAVLFEAFADGWPVDPITVADELARRGQLEGIGGTVALVAMQSATPAVSSADRYAKIVHDHATLRRLLSYGSEVAELAYSLPDDAHAAVLRAENLLGHVASNNGARPLSTLEIADVAALLAGNLQNAEPELCPRTDGKRLFYSGKMHFLQGEPSSGKSWIALYASLEILRIGGAVLYLDYEDVSTEIVRRMLNLGADPLAVGTRFSYIQPIGPIGPTERVELDRHVAALNPDLVVIDGVAEALSREGLREDLATDVVPWIDSLPRRLARTGAAVVMVDHVVKDKEQQGRWARGSSAKLAVVDGATYQVKTITPFDRHRDGLLKMVIAKDKPGGVGAMGDTVGLVHVEPKAGGERVLVRIEPDTSKLGLFRPTRLMQEVSEELERSDRLLTPSQVRTLIRSNKPEAVSTAIVRLVQDGYVAETVEGKTTKLVSLKPYRGDEHEQPPPAEPEPELDFDPTEAF